MASTSNYKNNRISNKDFTKNYKNTIHLQIKLWPRYEKYINVQIFICYEFTTLPNKVDPTKPKYYNIKHCNLSTTPSK